jgi:hypothetical protein
MKGLSKLLILALLAIGQSCGLLSGYKDSQHFWYARGLTKDEKQKLDNGDTLEVTYTYPTKSGRLIITKGNPNKFGRYIFVEVGEWRESFDYVGSGTLKGRAITETTYDSYGNMVLRTVSDKTKKDNEFYTREIIRAEMRVINMDTVLVQNIKVFNNKLTLTWEFNLAVLNYKEMLSDRLKNKIKVGKETWYDDNGKLTKSYDYKYEDKIKGR